MDNEQTNKIFGPIKDNKKDVVLSCRISKEIDKIFKEHVDSLNENIKDNKKKDKATVLKEIFLNYIENMCYKRGTINYKPVYIFLPKIKNTENFHQDYGDPFIIHEYDAESPTTDPLTDLTTLFDSVHPVGIYDYAKDYYSYDEIEKQILIRRSEFKPEETLVVSFYLNNQLDRLKNGYYSEGLKDKNMHEGFLIFEYEDFTYNIKYKYLLENDKAEYKIANLITNEEAYERAKFCNNIELAQIIDNYAKGLSNIENDIRILKSKRDYHQKQIKDINKQIKKLKK